MPFNDLSARDLQMVTTQWTLGKAIDGFAPCGPALVTLDEAGPLSALRLTTDVNGTRYQDGGADQLIFDVPYLVSFLSRTMTLEPGDVIATGTPAGVGLGAHPPRYLSDGDVVEVGISGLGTMRNRIVMAPPAG
jgi:2-keto-4-pentenoate hydratase/2-oxohepta-3-ene-1,7-dioic acid hydratase in catechol pathway